MLLADFRERQKQSNTLRNKLKSLCYLSRKIEVLLILASQIAAEAYQVAPPRGYKTSQGSARHSIQRRVNNGLQI